MLNDKDKYESIIERAREEKDSEVQIKFIIEILDMMCTNDLHSIYSYLKKVNKKLTFALIAAGLIAVFLLLTNPEIFNIFRLAKGM